MIIHERYALSVVTAATSEPVTLAELKEHLRVTGDDEDSYIEGLGRAARVRVELLSARALMTQTLRLTMDSFPGRMPASLTELYAAGGTIELPRAPVQSVSSVTYIDTDGTTQTLAGGDYVTDLISEPARIVPAYGKTWPTTRSQINAVAITFVAGYSSAASVPDAAKHAIKMLVAHWFENREPLNIGNIVNPLPLAVDALIAQLRWDGI